MLERTRAPARPQPTPGSLTTALRPTRCPAGPCRAGTAAAAGTGTARSPCAVPEGDTASPWPLRASPEPLAPAGRCWWARGAVPPCSACPHSCPCLAPLSPWPGGSPALPPGDIQGLSCLSPPLSSVLPVPTAVLLPAPCPHTWQEVARSCPASGLGTGTSCAIPLGCGDTVTVPSLGSGMSPRAPCHPQFCEDTVTIPSPGSGTSCATLGCGEMVTVPSLGSRMSPRAPCPVPGCGDTVTVPSLGTRMSPTALCHPRLWGHSDCPLSGHRDLHQSHVPPSLWGHGDCPLSGHRDLPPAEPRLLARPWLFWWEIKAAGSWNLGIWGWWIWWGGQCRSRGSTPRLWGCSCPFCTPRCPRGHDPGGAQAPLSAPKSHFYCAKGRGEERL
uniref:vegetative cell wall protein gp1-like n=1 Tax=Lonchura striata TaxID=40157 RepID=UPI000B4DBA79|nr:vegetative cell wall protein gp1-like [Lonchura striata domestica]